MLIPKKNRLTVYKNLFEEGVLVAKDDFVAPKHATLDVPNLQVIKLMQSLVSRGYAKRLYNWKHHYYTLTNEGIEYLRQYLHLPAEIVPNTLKKSTRPERPEGREGRPERGERREFDRNREGGERGERGERGGFRGGRRDFDKDKLNKPEGEFTPAFRGEGRGGYGRGRSEGQGENRGFGGEGRGFGGEGRGFGERRGFSGEGRGRGGFGGEGRGAFQQRSRVAPSQ